LSSPPPSRRIFLGFLARSTRHRMAPLDRFPAEFVGRHERRLSRLLPSISVRAADGPSAHRRPPLSWPAMRPNWQPNATAMPLLLSESKLGLERRAPAKTAIWRLSIGRCAILTTRATRATRASGTR
jgi:hypothetical protein